MRGILDFKLQLGCLILLLYIIVVYVRQTSGKNRDIGCNRYFDFIIAVAPWTVFFDGLTAWTVNNRDIVPEWCNNLFHCLFYVFINLFITGVYMYIINFTMGPPNNRIRYLLILLPSIIATAICLGFMGQVYYVDDVYTSYSLGVSPYSCFALAAILFITDCILMIVKHRTIEKRKKISTFIWSFLAGLILVLQIVFPQILITSLFPTFVVIGIYVIFEDPSRRRLEIYNAKMVMGFATLVENRDDNTGGHIQRTAGYVSIILEEMKRKARYNRVISKDYISNVKAAAPMHDIGKIATPDSILQKPGPLTDEEFEIMKEHSATGSNIIRKTFAQINDPEYLEIAYNVTRYHHEKWNGKGYPDGLVGEDIPLEARIMAIADVFDAVSADRCYRPAMPLDVCFDIIEKGAGVDFDPDLVDLFLKAKPAVIKLHSSVNE